MPPSHPGEILREDVLPALGLTIQNAAAKLGVTRRIVHRIIARDNPRPVTPEMARQAVRQRRATLAQPARRL